MQFTLLEILFRFNQQPVLLVCRDPLGGLQNVDLTLTEVQVGIDAQVAQGASVAGGAAVCNTTIAACVAIATAKLRDRFPQLGAISVVPQPASAPAAP